MSPSSRARGGEAGSGEDRPLSRTLALFIYKLRFFFGPALRGRFGPLAYVGLILIFLPSGFAFGITLGTTIRGADTTTAVDVLASPLAGLLSFGLLYALGAGVTAHASEFDFFLTADVRPREYLAADLLFQLVSLVGAGFRRPARARLRGRNRPRLVRFERHVHRPWLAADDVRRVRPGRQGLANGNPAAYHGAARRAHDARALPARSGGGHEPHDPPPSRPNLAGREHPARGPVRDHR